MLNQKTNGFNVSADFELIKSKLIQHGYSVIDDITKESIRVIGLFRTGLGQVGCLLNQELYTLRSVYMDEDDSPHLSTCTIGGAILDNNIENYNLRTIVDIRNIIRVEYLG